MRMTLLNMVFGSVSLACTLSAVHACPTGVPSRPTPSATGRNLWKGTQTCFGAGVRTSQGRVAGFWEGERASEGRGCFERGTLNADRKANRKRAGLFNVPLMA